MFFIGGFNSVIPYVVYLSLIWTFMILSFGGRIAAILHKHSDKEFTSAKVISKEGDHHYLNCYHYDSVRQSQNETTADVPDLSPLSWSSQSDPTYQDPIRLTSFTFGRTIFVPVPGSSPFQLNITCFINYLFC